MGTAAPGCSVEQSSTVRADYRGVSSFCEISNQLEARSAAVGRAPAAAAGCPGSSPLGSQPGCTRGGHRFGGQRRSSSLQQRVCSCPGDGWRSASIRGWERVVLGAFIIQVSGRDSPGKPPVFQFAERCGSFRHGSRHQGRRSARGKAETFASAWISKPNRSQEGMNNSKSDQACVSICELGPAMAMAILGETFWPRTGCSPRPDLPDRSRRRGHVLSGLPDGQRRSC